MHLHFAPIPDWEAGAYSPLTNTMYMPPRNMCQRLLATTSPDASHRIYALAVRHETRARHRATRHGSMPSPPRPVRPAGCTSSGPQPLSLVATGGGGVFGGDANGRFCAFDQETGEVLWEINLGSSVAGFPIDDGWHARRVREPSGWIRQCRWGESGPSHRRARQR